MTNENTQDQRDARRWRALKDKRPIAFHFFMVGGGVGYSNRTSSALVDAVADALADEVENFDEAAHRQELSERMEKRKREISALDQETDKQRRTPEIYQDTVVRGVLPVEDGKIAFSLGADAKTAIYVRIPVYDALWLSSALVNYIALSQSPRTPRFLFSRSNA
ncbi:MAG: hypothetical protein FWC38_00880 [Proteobacteria bacterium]|nr:hypothetical protein [Pseudomonadota bacterium]